MSDQCPTVLPGMGQCCLESKHDGPHQLNTANGGPELLICPDYDIRTGNPCILPYRHPGHCRTKERTYTAAEVAEVKAQCAAMLEKAAKRVPRIVAEQDSEVDTIEGVNNTMEHVKREIRSLIPTDYAEALAEHDSRLRMELAKHQAAMGQGQVIEVDENGTVTVPENINIGFEEAVAERVREAVQEELKNNLDACEVDGDIQYVKHYLACRLQQFRATSDPPKEGE